MIALKRILLPTDFSDCSRKAQKYACALAEQFGAELHVLHVLENPLPYAAGPELGAFLPEDYLTELKAAAQRQLAAIPEAAWCAGKTVVRELRSGPPFLETIRYAKDANIDLIVLGTHGRSGLTHVLLGSVAEKIVRKAPCPVLSIRPDGHEFVMP